MEKLESRKASLVNTLSHKLSAFARRRNYPLDPDSLLVQTTINSAVHYAPQDIAVLATTALITNRGHKKLANAKPVLSQDKAIAGFLKNHGLTLNDVDIHKSRKSILVSLRD